MGSALQLPPTEFDHRIGYLDAAVIMVEYGDYQCPYCKVAAPVVERLIEEFRNDLCFIFRHFPMKNIHPHAELAALAAEAAGAQDKFWGMHRLLFQNSESLSVKNIGLMAQELNLEIEQFQNDFRDPSITDKIQKDIESALKSEVTGTPTFYLNGYRFENSSSYEPLKEAIEELIDMRRESSYY